MSRAGGSCAGGGLEALLVGGDDRDHRHVLGQGDVLEAVDDERDLLGLVLGLRDLGHLLHVVDEHDEPSFAGQRAVLLDELADVVDRAGRLRATQQEQVLTVARDAVERRAQARLLASCGVAAPSAIHVPRISCGRPGS